MRFLPSEIPEVLLIEPQVFGDSRGFFMETWHAEKFAAAGLDLDFVQDNHSMSVQGTLRGLHYQIRKPQGKLVRVISGEVFDVAVDLRKSSPFFGRWVGEILSAENKKMLWVPPGFAHGFYVLSPEAEFVYKCTELYAPEHECCIRWDDPQLGIVWPLLAQAPLLSAKDLAGLSLAEAELYP
ncbi:dTDP-4-dehydrorhamnose 3,5-epimerase [Thiovibrio frasassiensis]|uniref:dTDP-4-dehydrorhamnose 3,5-epimerase n=1 Tax=Thiovibrio frasassiensis TaxID=2984131 RepID=A0A9X4MK24_9BACT|nr:dTDP-4-dehydrorhamnose 3,5-epimerase [Thiovibrio frasassiensis]MDG4476284.1 dTDP-4-dehydrorhamnose 3,5-epimerase [Thiovibrio frasassiensis]